MYSDAYQNILQHITENRNYKPLGVRIDYNIGLQSYLDKSIS